MAAFISVSQESFEKEFKISNFNRRRERKSGWGLKGPFLIEYEIPLPPGENGGILCIRGFLWGFSKTRTRDGDGRCGRPSFPLDFPVILSFKDGSTTLTFRWGFSPTHGCAISSFSVFFSPLPSRIRRKRLLLLLSWRGVAALLRKKNESEGCRRCSRVVFFYRVMKRPLRVRSLRTAAPPTVQSATGEALEEVHFAALKMGTLVFWPER